MDPPPLQMALERCLGKGPWGSSPPPEGSRDGTTSSSGDIEEMPWKRPWRRWKVQFRRDVEDVIRDVPPPPPPPTCTPSPPPGAPPSPSGVNNPEPNPRRPLPKFVKHPTATQCFRYGPTFSKTLNWQISSTSKGRPTSTICFRAKRTWRLHCGLVGRVYQSIKSTNF